jgi:glycosyltransferase involved in cell wall biosynthesis
VAQRLSIIHLTTYLQGGAGRAIVDLACAQHRAGHDVLVVTSNTADAGYGNYPQHLDALRRARVPLLIEDSLFKRDGDLNRRVLTRLLNHCHPDDVDLVHAHAATPARIGRLFAGHASKHVPVVQTQHGWGISKTPQQAADDLATLNDIEQIIVTSDATRDLLRDQGVRNERMETIPCGLSPHPSPLPPISHLPYLSHPFTVGCIGSVTRNKNQRALLAALTSRAARDVAAVFIGEGGDTLALEAQALGIADRVHVLGYQPDAWRWLPMFDALVVPSRTEGQGLVVLEAFRAGVPVIASDIPAFRLLVTEGESGWLFDLDRPAALEEALARARQAPLALRDRIITTARGRFLESYTLDTMLARHEALYRSMTDRRHQCG